MYQFNKAVGAYCLIKQSEHNKTATLHLKVDSTNMNRVWKALLSNVMHDFTSSDQGIKGR
jgi:hypothetical protein